MIKAKREEYNTSSVDEQKKGKPLKNNSLCGERMSAAGRWVPRCANTAVMWKNKNTHTYMP